MFRLEGAELAPVYVAEGRDWKERNELTVSIQILFNLQFSFLLSSLLFNLRLIRFHVAITCFVILNTYNFQS